MTGQYVRPISLAETNQRNVANNIYQLTNFVNSNTAVFNAKSYGAVGDGRTDDAAAITAAINAASVSGGLVLLPTATYLVKSGLVIPNNVSLAGSEVAQTVIEAGANGITSLVKITANNLSSVRHVTLSANSFNTTNGLEFAPGVFGNNWLTAEDVLCIGFTNNFLNSNADLFRIINCFSQNATGYGIKSIFSGTGSRITGFKSLGDNAGIYYAPGANTTEGAIITDSEIIITGTGKAIQFDQSLFCQITNVAVDGQIYLNGTSNTHAFCVVDGVFISPSTGSSDSIGFLAQGNMSDLFLRGITSSGFSGSGMSIASSTSASAQRVYIDNYRASLNSSSDLKIDSTSNVVGPVYVSNSSFESTTTSILETTAHAIISQYGPGNNYTAAQSVSTGAGSVPSQITLGPWLSFSTSLSATGNGAAVDGTNGSVITYAKYQQTGKIVSFTVDFTLRNNSGTGTVIFDVPGTPAGPLAGSGTEVALTGKLANIFSASGNAVEVRDATGLSTTWAQSSRFIIAGTYEVS